MYIYVYICIYIYIYVCVCVYVCVYITTNNTIIPDYTIQYKTIPRLQ